MSTTKLFNSQGKQLYINPETMQKAKGRRKDRTYGLGLLQEKYMLNLTPFKRGAYTPQALLEQQ